jgi:Na+-transporting methylmalonyl-CoA/oxaloacetate decarboxylase gamma subunit
MITNIFFICLFFFLLFVVMYGIINVLNQINKIKDDETEA